jgi:hypothetical protein
VTTRPQLDEMETTRATKFLGWVLAAFLLVGGLWAYAQPLDRTDDGDVAAFEEPASDPAGSPGDRAAIERYRGIRVELRRAQESAGVRRRELVLAREAYRTALDAGEPAADLEGRYEQAQARLDEAEARVVRVQRRVEELAGPARAARERIADERRREGETVAEREDRLERETFGLRLAWVLLCLAGAFFLFNRLRRAHSRYLVAGMAAIGFATVQAIVMASDYTTDYIEITEVGPLVLSLAGIVLTLGALVAMQRYLARRLPRRRVRRRECPYCGFPAGAGLHCEGCGRALVANCANCDEPRRVGTPHCGACGSA